MRKLLIDFYSTAMTFLIVFVVGFASVNAYAASDEEVTEALQQNTVSGTVVDENGDPMPGVNILVKGSTIGAFTDINGKYTLSNVPSDAVLEFTFIGYKMITETVGGRSVIDVEMSVSSMALEEVVVIGYGVQKKSDLTGSVVRVNMDDKAALSNTNISQALSGTSAGINVQNSGGAGSNPSLSIRGRNTLSASTAPLIVVDGIIYNGSMSTINLNDVETIDILKDASAAAVYGSRSANGVMLITTKKGKTEKPVISFNMSTGFQGMTNNPMKVMNAQQYYERMIDFYYQQDFLYPWYKEVEEDAGLGTVITGDNRPVHPGYEPNATNVGRLKSVEEQNNYVKGYEIDWVDEVMQRAPISNYNLSVSGKSDKTSYYLSGSYTDETGILKGDDFSRITVLSNVDTEITKWLKIGANISYSYLDYSGLNASLGEARECSPLADNKYGVDGNWQFSLTGESYMEYPLVGLYADNEDKRHDLRATGTAKITVPWVKGLTYEFNYSNRYYSRRNNTFYPSTHPEGAGNSGKAIKNPSLESSWLMNNIITYFREFGDHQVNATLLYTREKRVGEGTNVTSEGFSNEMLIWNSLESGTIISASSDKWQETSLAYMARANYTYKDKYMFTGTVRRDGFSGFGVNNKYAVFPSLSLGWVVTEEDFMDNLDWLYLKTRLSYGQNGNQGMGRYTSLSKMSSAAAVFGPNTYIGLYPNTMGNPNLAWEKTTSLNLGFDYGFFQRRINGSIELYTANTHDVLVKRRLPQADGYTYVMTNIGKIANKGIEVELNSVNLKGALGWETNFVFSLNRDKIEELYGDGGDDLENGWFIGESISAIYDYNMLGIWSEEEFFNGKCLKGWYPGQPKYEDLNHDGAIDAVNDRKIIGYENPNFRWSLNNVFTFKNFTFSFFLNSIIGGKDYYIHSNTGVVNVGWRPDDVYRINQSAVRHYWTPLNGVTNATGILNAPAVHGGIYQSRSFVRLQDVSLSYTLPKSVLTKLKMSNAMIYLSGKNLYTFTGWSGWDPEIGVTDMPLMRNGIIGFRVTF